jgi:K+-sensing histidine kinase KdpD
MLDYLVHEINGRNQIVISNIEKILSETKNKKQNEQMKVILSLLFDNANAMKKSYKLIKADQCRGDMILYDPVEKLNEAIMAITNQFPDKDVRVHTQIEGVIPNVLADGFIEDVFYMLLEHSVKKTDEEVVDIDVSMNVDTPKRPTSIQIKITDHHGGIPDEKKVSIFDKSNILVGDGHVSPGLSIARRVIESYTGEIHAEDRIQGDDTSGTTFVINLPVSEGKK